MAQEKFKKIGDLFNYVDNYKDEENKGKAKELKRVCELNKAACALKLNDYQAAKTSCNTVLKDESDNVKALFRRAQADYFLQNFMDCMTDLKRLIEIDSGNTEAKRLMKQAQMGQKEQDKKSKGMYAKMCQALGKGPIPEPGKATHPRDYSEDDMDDDEGDVEAPTKTVAEVAPPKDAETAAAEGEAPVATAGA